MSLQSHARLAQQVTSLLILALMTVFAITQIFNAEGSVLRWVIQSVPLMLFLPGILLGRYRSGSWLCFVLLVYFLIFVVNLSGPGHAFLDSVKTLLTVALFISAMLFSRWQQRARIELETDHHDH